MQDGSYIIKILLVKLVLGDDFEKLKVIANKINHMKIKEYLKETKAELIHVSWPTRKQAIVYTIVVIVISFATAFFLGAFDYIFSTLLQKVI